MYAPQCGMGASYGARPAADPQALLPAIRKVVAQLNANLPLFHVTTQSEQIDRLLFQERLVARLSAFFGLLALVLACIGLYGLLSYEVAPPTREIGIRMALGAEQRDVTGVIILRGINLTVARAGAGIVGGLALTRVLASLLYGVKPTDPLTFIAVSLILTVVA